jgi:pimeloyl-ACP methyl ester carboxylesterase
MAAVETSEGRFTAEEAGPADGPLVVLLHGFPQSRHSWRAQVPFLAARGYHAVAPDGRGYSPGVRPDPSDLDAYQLSRLVADVLDIADAAGDARRRRAATAPGSTDRSSVSESAPKRRHNNDRRVHVVGHDWGGQVAWFVAAEHPDRVASLTVLSRPHPAAFQRALTGDTDDQRHRSRHHSAFLDPATATLLLEDGGRRLRRQLATSGVPDDHIDEYLSVVGNEDALEAALAWYRAARGLGRIELGAVTVPTLYLWGDADATVGRAAAEGTAAFVAADYRFEVLAGVGHFVTDQVPDTVNRLLLEHLATHP